MLVIFWTHGHFNIIDPPLYVLTKILIIVYTIFTMKMQQFNPKMISITQLRRDIDVLKKILAQESEALVMSNQSLLFVAIAPEKYKSLQVDERETIKKAVAAIEKIRQDFGGVKRVTTVSDYVSGMRERRIKKWKK